MRVCLQNERQIQTVLSMKTAKETRRWDRLDDVIMGGQSSSGMEASGSGAVWSGDLILEGGGFCGARLKVGNTLISDKSEISQVYVC